jgi:hypothetical protein
MSGRNYDGEFNNSVWDHYNQGGDGGVNFGVFSQEFLTAGLSANLHPSNLLSVISEFSKSSPNIKFDSQYPEGDPRRTENLEVKTAEAIQAAFDALKRLSVDSDFHISKHVLEIQMDTPDLIKALLFVFVEEGLKVHFSEASDHHTDLMGGGAASFNGAVYHAE